MVTTEQGRQRLYKLADVLDTVDEKNFSIDVWECGTVACAAGYACRIPEFKAAGLRMDYDQICKNEACGPVFENHTCFYALSYFFNISYDDAHALFTHYGYKVHKDDLTPKHVAKRLREFCDGPFTVATPPKEKP